MTTGNARAEEASPIEELQGKLASDPEEKRLMRSVLDNDEETVKDGKLITAAMNTGISSFTPDMMLEKLVTNYQLAKNIFGDSFLQEVAGYTESQIERNKHIGEFRQELKRRIKERLDSLKDEGLLDKEGMLTEKAAKLSKIILYTEELDKLAAKGLLGEKENRKNYTYGIKEDVKQFRKDRYRDLAVRNTIKLAVRRGRREIGKGDLLAFERKAKGKRNIIYALDASGSMKGHKLMQCKKAGIALAYKATQENDKVGLIVFGREVKKKIAPTGDFRHLLDEITMVTAKEKTNLAATVKEAIDMFPREEATKHLVLITDAMPTAGETPEKETLEAVATAADRGITTSIIGIDMRREGQEMAKRIAETGKGRVFAAKSADEIDQLILEDYYSS